MKGIFLCLAFLCLGTLGQQCRLHVSNSHLRAPVLYRNGDILDVYNNDTVEMNLGERFTAECSGENNLIENLDIQSKEFECISNGKIQVDGQSYEFSYLDCLRSPDIYTFQSSDEKCGLNQDLSLKHLYYGNSTTRLLTVCSNGTNPEWVKYSVENNFLNNLQKLRHLRHENEDNISPALLSVYQRSFQSRELEKINLKNYVHKCTADDEYCTYNDGFFITPATLSSTQHFKKFGAQRAVENYIAAKPIWENIRKGNLLKLQNNIGAVATDKNLTVLSGSYEQLLLKNAFNLEKPVEFTVENEKVTIPRYIWVAAISFGSDLNATEGAAFLIHNRIEINDKNPAPPNEVGNCTLSLCSSLSYIDLDNENIDQGYVYCCDLAALQQFVTLEVDLPEDVPLLV